jgi:hypothetical protein
VDVLSRRTRLPGNPSALRSRVIEGRRGRGVPFLLRLLAAQVFAAHLVAVQELL